MIQIDRRTGSAHLTGLLKAMQVPCELTTLDYGDAAFVGRGPDDRPVAVGIEVKRIAELLTDRERFTGHQLPGLLANYEAVWLIVQGMWRIGSDGTLEVPHGRNGSRARWSPLAYGGRGFCWRDYAGLLTTLETKAHVRIRQTTGADQTARTIAALYHWWTSKTWEAHRAHLAWYDPPEGLVPLVEPPTVARVAHAAVQGIGWRRAHAIAQVFPTVEAMVSATAAEWRLVDGIGTVLAKRMVEALHG